MRDGGLPPKDSSLFSHGWESQGQNLRVDADLGRPISGGEEPRAKELHVLGEAGGTIDDPESKSAEAAQFDVFND